MHATAAKYLTIGLPSDARPLEAQAFAMPALSNRFPATAETSIRFRMPYPLKGSAARQKMPVF
jgi:hypothetical protein